MSNAPDNIDRFNLMTLALFQKLYGAFPAPIEIDPGQIGSEAAPEDASDRTQWDSGAEAGHAITWLAEEGFLRFESQSTQGDFYEVRLSLKGLSVLGSLPTALAPTDPKETVIARIKRTLASGTEKAGTEAVKGIISEIFKLSLRYGLSGGGEPGVSV